MAVEVKNSERYDPLNPTIILRTPTERYNMMLAAMRRAGEADAQVTKHTGLRPHDRIDLRVASRNARGRMIRAAS